MPYEGLNLEGKNALVTGSARGIGRALVVGLAAAGANVAVSDTSERLEESRETQEMIENLGAKSGAYLLDVLDVGKISSTLQQVSEDLGGLGILINNAGVRVRKLALEVTEDEWDYVVDTNLKGVFFCAQAAAKQMIPRGSGRIINIASQFAIVAQNDRAPYCDSKGGVAKLTKALALEWARYKIIVNAIGPGPTDTPGIQIANPRSPEDIQREMDADMPLGRRMEPEELVGAAIYLASPSAVATTGHLLIVDGGWTAR